MGLSSAATRGSGTFGGLPQCTEADRMTADETEAAKCCPRSCRERRASPKTMCEPAGVVPALANLTNQAKSLKCVKYEGLQFRIKKGHCLKIFAANLLKAKKSR